MDKNKSRKMKVYSQAGYHYKNVPAIILKGEWLRKNGFESGDKINISIQNGRLIIDNLTKQSS